MSTPPLTVSHDMQFVNYCGDYCDQWYHPDISFTRIISPTKIGFFNFSFFGNNIDKCDTRGFTVKVGQEIWNYSCTFNASPPVDGLFQAVRIACFGPGCPPPPPLPPPPPPLPPPPIQVNTFPRIALDGDGITIHLVFGMGIHTPGGRNDKVYHFVYSNSQWKNLGLIPSQNSGDSIGIATRGDNTLHAATLENGSDLVHYMFNSGVWSKINTITINNWGANFGPVLFGGGDGILYAFLVRNRFTTDHQWYISRFELSGTTWNERDQLAWGSSIWATPSVAQLPNGVTQLLIGDASYDVLEYYQFTNNAWTKGADLGEHDSPGSINKMLGYATLLKQNDTLYTLAASVSNNLESLYCLSDKWYNCNRFAAPGDGPSMVEDALGNTHLVIRRGGNLTHYIFDGVWNIKNTQTLSLPT